MLQHFLFLNFVVFPGASSTSDYWSGEFDKNKNCLQEEKIVELRNKVN